MVVALLKHVHAASILLRNLLRPFRDHLFNDDRLHELARALLDLAPVTVCRLYVQPELGIRFFVRQKLLHIEAILGAVQLRVPNERVALRGLLRVRQVLRLEVRVVDAQVGLALPVEGSGCWVTLGNGSL